MPLALPLSGYSFTLTAWDLNAHLFPDPVFRVDPEKFGVVKARHAILPEGRDRHVQQLMAILGLLDAKTDVDGRFGTSSANVFKAFQLSCNTPQTGIVDSAAYLLLCDAVRRVQATAPAKGAAGTEVADLRPLPEPATSTRSQQYAIAAGASATAAGATVVGSNYFAPKAVTGDTSTPPPPSTTVATPTTPATPGPTSTEKTQAVTALTVAPPAAPAPDWDDTARELLPGVAVGLLIITLVLIILSRRRAY